MATVTSQIRTGLKNVLAGISPSIGNVYDYERWAVDWATFLAQLRDPGTGLIRFWTLGREKGSGLREASAEAARIWTYAIRGYRGHKDADATEKAFDDDVEIVCDTLGTQLALGLTALVDFVNEPQVRGIEPVMLGGVLMHRAEIGLDIHVTKHYGTLTP